MPGRTKEKEWSLMRAIAYDHVKNVPGCVVDIGIGVSTSLLRPISEEFGRNHYSCDRDRRKCDWASGIGIRSSMMDQAGFLETFDSVCGEPVSLLFHDADHSYEAVKRIVTFFSERMSGHGMIMVHDTYPPVKAWEAENYSKFTAYKFRMELEEDPGFQVFTFPYTAVRFGLTIIMKKLPCFWIRG